MSPLDASPDDLPLVTQAQIDAFLSCCYREVKPRTRSGAPVAWQRDEVAAAERRIGGVDACARQIQEVRPGTRYPTIRSVTGYLVNEGAAPDDAAQFVDDWFPDAYRTTGDATRRTLRWLLGGQLFLAVALVLVDIAPSIPSLLSPSHQPELTLPTRPGDQTRRYRPRDPANPGPGGSVFDALQIGRTIREIGAQTRIVEGAVCLSACPYVFFGGTERIVFEGARVGVHQHSFGESTILPAFLAVEDVQRGQAEVLDHLDAMGIDLRIMGPAMATPADEIYILTAEEIEQWNVTTE